MAVTDPETGDPGLAADTQAEIARVRASGLLGRSGRLLELYDFLAARSFGPSPPKELEIALEVFGKPGGGAAGDDATARVYVHRLRKRLEDYYLHEAAPGGVRLELPKGEYRIRGVRLAAPAPALDPGIGPQRAEPERSRRAAPAWWTSRTAFAALAVLAAANLAAWALHVGGGRGGEIDAVRRDPVWAELVDDDRPVMIVVGDYYMYGELEAGLFLNRLVRDFAINSREDLLASQRSRPDAASDTMDVDARYLPVSTAYALARVAQVFPDGRDVRVTLASEVRPETLRDYDIVYIGLVSGLGPLREPSFVASRFAVGASYDILVDTQSGQTYESEAFLAPSDGMYRDYGLLSRFRGPRGNAVLVLAGARDAGLAGVAESATRADSLRALHVGGAKQGVEALYEIQGQGHVSLESAVLAAAARDGAKAWSTLEVPLEFPAE